MPNWIRSGKDAIPYGPPPVYEINLEYYNTINLALKDVLMSLNECGGVIILNCGITDLVQIRNKLSVWQRRHTCWRINNETKTCDYKPM